MSLSMEEKLAGLAGTRPSGVPRGEAHVNAKLSEEVVRSIRRLHGEGHGYGRIAATIGVSRATVERVVKRLAWAHVE